MTISKLLRNTDIVAAYHAFLAHMGFDNSQVVVSAGAACVLYGIRKETEDIDVEIWDAPRFHKLANAGWPVKHYTEDGVAKFSVETKWGVSVHQGQHPPVSTIRLVSGVLCLTPEALLQQKRKLNRPKDQADIAGLERWLNRAFSLNPFPKSAPPAERLNQTPV